MKDYSESAFPLPERADAAGRQGMTLRDYFAAAALKGVLSSVNPPPVPVGEASGDTWAKAAYQWADAMLAARAK